MDTVEGPPAQNRMLRALPAAALERIRASSSSVEIPRGTVLHEPGAQVDWLYFPMTGLVSVLATDAGGGSVEIAVVGREGGVGIVEVVGEMRMPTESYVQVSGTAIRVRGDALLSIMREDDEVRRLINRYLAALFVEAAQGAACHRLHSLEARTARWLMTTRDRMGVDHIDLTHELTALMVGASRPKVTAAIGALERSGLLRSDRGRIVILDPDGMLTRVCDCYGIIREATASLYPDETEAPESAFAT